MWGDLKTLDLRPTGGGGGKGCWKGPLDADPGLGEVAWTLSRPPKARMVGTGVGQVGGGQSRGHCQQHFLVTHHKGHDY